MKDIVIFGAGDYASIVYNIIVNHLHKTVGCFVVDDKYYEENVNSLLSLPIISESTFIEHFSPDDCSIVLGFLGSEMFDKREEKHLLYKKRGFSFENIIDTDYDDLKSIGEGNVIMRHVSIGYQTIIGNCNVLWQGVTLPHHNVIGDYNNIAPTVSFSGYSGIGSHCFIGNNSTIKNKVMVSDYTFVGAGAYITKDTEKEQVIVPAKSYPLDNKKSKDFY